MTKLSDLFDDITPIDQTYGAAYIEWGSPEGGSGSPLAWPMVIWNEGLRFHTQQLREYETFNEDTIVDQVQDKLQQLLGTDYDCFVRWSDWDAEEIDGIEYPYLEFSVWYKDSSVFTPDMEDEDAFDYLWPAVATIHNVTDPGTFNCPYLFTGLAYIKTYDEDDED